jgi:hypothetical protein
LEGPNVMTYHSIPALCQLRSQKSDTGASTSYIRLFTGLQKDAGLPYTCAHAPCHGPGLGALRCACCSICSTTA